MEPSPQQINTNIYHLYTTNQEKQLRGWLISHDLLKHHTPQGTVEPPGIRDFQKAARLRRPLRHPRRVDGCTDGCIAAFWAFAVGAWGKGFVQFYLNNNNKKTVILLVDIRVLYMNVLRKNNMMISLLQTWKLYFIFILLMHKDLHHLVQKPHGSTNYLPNSTTKFHSTIRSPFHHRIKRPIYSFFAKAAQVLKLLFRCEDHPYV